VSLTQVGEDMVIGSAHWTGADGVPTESNPVVITFRDGKIRDMQECATQREAEQLYREAKRLGVKGRSKMNKGQLKAALTRRGH